MNTSSHAVSTSSGSRSRSVLTRITSSVTSRPRNVNDFNIQLEDPTRKYTSGDVVKGSVHLLVQKPTSITHIVLSLHGFVKVYKTATLPGDGIPSEVKTPSPGRGRSGPQYRGNSLMSLFENESVICGDGRLNPGQYSFKFETQFPFSCLPSSLDFERGTVSYVLVATLTRPTTMMPTMSCEKKLSFLESIDVAFLNIPKPRTVTLTPLTKRPKPKSKPQTQKSVQESRNTASPTTSNPRISDSSSDANASTEDNQASSASSRGSTVSAPSSSMSFQVAQSSRISALNEVSAASEKVGNNVIKASVELSQGGYLPGDLIPVRVLVQHIRQVKSMHGIIVTLYRKARIDPHPVSAPGQSIHLNNSPYDDILPQSRTGLGGLSLSTSTSHIFRMDLAQSFASMVVNPATLQAEIKAKVRVPDDIFPTIFGIPGDMITFTYHVEVVMDLTGRLAKQDRKLPRMNMTSQSPAFSLGSKPSQSGYGAQSSLETYHLIDTTELRRGDKRIPECTFEIVVGTQNSGRPQNQGAHEPWGHDRSASRSEDGSTTEEISTVDVPSPDSTQDTLRAGPDRTPTINPPMIPPPELEEPANEKERLRLAEARLLPSAPPEDELDGSSSGPQPSAPTLDRLGDGCGPEAYLGFDLAVDEHGESAPAYYHETQPSSGAAARGEDKQELERQRLLAMASSPDDRANDQDGDEAGPATSAPVLPVPSAPVLDEDGDVPTQSGNGITGKTSRPRE